MRLPGCRRVPAGHEHSSRRAYAWTHISSANPAVRNNDNTQRVRAPTVPTKSVESRGRAAHDRSTRPATGPASTHPTAALARSQYLDIEKAHTPLALLWEYRPYEIRLVINGEAQTTSERGNQSRDACAGRQVDRDSATSREGTGRQRLAEVPALRFTHNSERERSRPSARLVLPEMPSGSVRGASRGGQRCNRESGRHPERRAAVG